jgi:creatinine amidohydrolase
MEQHGPHLPVGVDTFLCEGVCRRTADIAAKSAPVVVAPTLWCGLAEHHMAFGGTFTFDLPTYRAVIFSFLRNIARHGFKRVLIVNGHGGNKNALNAFLADFVRETGLTIRVTTYFDVAPKQIEAILEDQKAIQHACEAETSMIMAEVPHLVKRERLADAHGPAQSHSASGMPPFQRFASYKSFTPSGVVGDARRASADKGERLLAAVSQTIATYIVDDRNWAD